MIVLGIDPGLSGALTIISDQGDGPRPTIVACIDVPTAGEKSRRRVVASAVIGFIQRGAPHFAFIERAQAMPEQGATSGFIYGRAVGVLEACVEGLRIPLDVVEPTAWKKYHALIKQTKEDSRQRAMRVFPDGLDYFQRRLDHHRAESALIAAYGLNLRRAAGQVRGFPDIPAPSGDNPRRLDRGRESA